MSTADYVRVAGRTYGNFNRARRNFKVHDCIVMEHAPITRARSSGEVPAGEPRLKNYVVNRGNGVCKGRGAEGKKRG